MPQQETTDQHKIDALRQPLPRGFTFRDAGVADASQSIQSASKRLSDIARFERTLSKLGSRWYGGPAVVITAAMMTGITWALILARHLLDGQRPPISFYLIPIAFAASTLGRRGGIIVTAVVAAISFCFLFGNLNGSHILIHSFDIIAISGFLISCLIVVLLIGRLHDSIAALERAYENLVSADTQLIESEERRSAFNQEVLLAVTNGRLLLSSESEIARLLRGDRILRCPLTEPRHVTVMRQSVRKELNNRSRLSGRLYDLEACATEAATNAIKHGNGGYFELWDDGENVMALIVDSGSGIEPNEIARATLERGYSTRVSLGLGFKMMWELADLIAVSTGPNGTTILIRIGEAACQQPEDDLFSRFPTLED